ncbi:MAG: exodeoxyribonuclease VII large subunit [Terriglobales bacterium]
MMQQAELSFGPERKVWTVSELLGSLKRLLEREYFDAWIEGEISNFHQAASRHCYFTLKDGQGQLRAALFSGQARHLRFQLRDGMQVLVRGRLSLWEARGDLQCYVEHVEPLGQGGLQLAFEQLKEKLAAEGLFDPRRKRPLPMLPRRVGVITSPRGAAVADMLRILHRRYPNLDILLYPVAVQGAAAVGEICAALRHFAQTTPCPVDVLIVGRGGGSLEDLWAFNEEAVARALAQVPVPTISGVGHETDFTIADFVADVRAATPSAAAEVAIRPKAEFLAQHLALRRHLERAARYRLLQAQRRLAELSRHRGLYAMRQRLNQRAQAADDLHRRLELAQRQGLRQRLRRLEATAARLRQGDARARLVAVRAVLTAQRTALRAAFAGSGRRRRERLERAAAILAERSPLRILERGYALVYDAEGRLVTAPAAVAGGDALRLRLAGGWLGAEVKKVEG